MSTRIHAMNSRKVIICFFSDASEPIDPSLLVEGFSFAKHFFGTLGVQLDKASYRFRKPPNRMKNHKLYDFDKTEKRIFQANSEGNLILATVYHFGSVLTKDKALAAFDWLVVAEFGLLNNGIALFQLGIDTRLFDDYREASSRDLIIAACHKATNWNAPRYGFVTCMPRDFMPLGYATGLMGRAGDELVRDANSWNREASREYASRLRNLHGINFINTHHLAQRVGGQKLTEWVDSSAQRGLIRQWSKDLYSWSFENCVEWPDCIQWENAQLSLIRTELERHHFFPWQKLTRGRN